jgi:hypothetical protein
VSFCSVPSNFTFVLEYQEYPITCIL